MSFDLLMSVVKKVAPILGGSIAGPGGAALATVIADKFGGSELSQEEVVEKIQLDPEAKDKLLEIQTQYLLERERLAIDRMAEMNKEMANAREMAVKSGGGAQAFLAKCFIAGYFLMAILIIIALWSRNVTGDELGPVIQVLKDLGLAIMMILSFYFGAAYKNG